MKGAESCGGSWWPELGAALATRARASLPFKGVPGDSALRGLADAELAGARRHYSDGSAGTACSCSTSRSACAMSSSRRCLQRRARKLLMSRSPSAVVSSAFNAASLCGIGLGLAADLPGLRP